MSEPINFRTAFNGFNREDVVHYIDYLNSRHNSQVNQLQADLAALQKDQLSAEAAPDQDAVLTALKAEKDELLSKCAQLETLLSDLTAENRVLAEKAARLEAQSSALTNEAPAPNSLISPYLEEELAAYRRAERVERLATERANTVCRQLRDALRDSKSYLEQVLASLDDLCTEPNEE